MFNKKIIIGIIVLILVILGFVGFSRLSGNVISNPMPSGEIIENEYFKIDDTNVKREVDLNDLQNNSGQE